MKSIVTLTVNPAIDVNATVHQAIPERKLRCEDLRREPGGGGINVSRAIRRLGGSSLAIFVSGGPIGELLQGLLKDEGIDFRTLSTEGMTRENVIIHEEASERHFRFAMPGAELEQEVPREIREVLFSADASPDYLVLSGSLPPGIPADFYATVARLGRERDCRVIVDASGEALRHAADEGAFLLKPNLREFGQLVGNEDLEEDEVATAARALVEDSPNEAVVVSLGRQGALVVTKEIRQRIQAPTVPIRSKVGAGDSMIAGIALALSRDRPILEAARRGIAAGAAAVMTPGTELCRKEDAERILRRL
jgi:6-phosphofructokinase 2